MTQHRSSNFEKRAIKSNFVKHLLFFIFLICLISKVSVQNPCQGYVDCDFCQPAYYDSTLPLCYLCTYPWLFPDYVPKLCDFCNNIIPQCMSCQYPTGITQCEFCGTGTYINRDLPNRKLQGNQIFFLLSLDCKSCGQSCPGQSFDSDNDKRCDCKGIPNFPYINQQGNDCVSTCDQFQIPTRLSLVTKALQCVRSCEPFFLNYQGKRCVQKCGVYQVVNKFGQCQCREDTFRIKGKCQPKPEGLLINLAQTSFITICGKNQVQTSDGRCLCKKPYFANGQDCVQKCPAKKYIDLLNRKCVDSCGSKFVSQKYTCTTFTQCEQLSKDNLLKFQEVCRCQKGRAFHEKLQQCIAERDCRQWNGQFLDQKTYGYSACLACSQNCKTCEGVANNCTNCKTRSVLVQREGQATFKCEECSDKHCLVCQDKPNNCVRCQPGYAYLPRQQVCELII